MGLGGGVIFIIYNAIIGEFIWDFYGRVGLFIGINGEVFVNILSVLLGLFCFVRLGGFSVFFFSFYLCKVFLVGFMLSFSLEVSL